MAPLYPFEVEQGASGRIVSCTVTHQRIRREMGLRKDRLADQIRDIVSGFFTGGKLSDPRLEGVSITHVKLSADLQIAHIYFRLFSGEDAISEVTPALRSCASLLRKGLSQELRVRRVPELIFLYDESIERGARIEKLLQED